MPQPYSLHTDKTWAQTYAELEDCFRKWGVRDWEVRKQRQRGPWISKYRCRSCMERHDQRAAERAAGISQGTLAITESQALANAFGMAGN